MKGRKKHGGGHRAKNVYLLSGLCFCGKCGRSVIGSSAQSYQTRVSKKHRERNIYVCTGARLHGEEKCRLPRYPKEVLEKPVMDIIRQQLFTDEVFTELVCDGLHVHPAVLSSVITMARAGRRGRFAKNI